MPEEKIQTTHCALSRNPQEHALIGRAKELPVSSPAPVVSISPVVLPYPDRAVDLQVRISAPVTGSQLPIVLLSHGHGRSNHLSSLLGYGPMANFLAAHGFVVIQPTHLDSKSLSLDPSDSEGPLFWKSRAKDMRYILDNLDRIESEVPHLKGRLGRERAAIVGHSIGGHTASMLLGMTLTDPADGSLVNLTEARFKAGVVLGAPGNGGADLSSFAADHYSFFLRPDFSTMTIPTLVVSGDRDVSPHLTVRGADWTADPYHLSPGPKCLLTLFGAGHLFGGISGYDAAETSDENPERFATVQRLVWAYLRTALYPEDQAWRVACEALATIQTLGRVECK